MPTRQNVSLLVRQQPSQFILFTDYSPESAHQECQSLVCQAISSLNPRYTCILCKTHFPSKLTATTHAHTYERAQTRQNSRVCLSQAIRDTSFYLFTCPKCPATFSNQTNLLMHMQLHVDKKIYKCRLCAYTSIKHCQVTEHLFCTHAARTNISCQACPLAVAPYFTHVHDNLVHLSTAHHNALATTLVNLFPDGDNGPAVLEVISQGLN